MDMKDFLNVLASKEPVPGGGGACGYVAAVGMALGNMVLSLTTGKKKYAEYQEEIEELIVKAGDITNRLYECMDKDAKAFKPLSEAYGLPKDTEEQLEHRNKVMENALLIASEAPLSMMELIVEAIKLIDRISVIGSRLAHSEGGRAELLVVPGDDDLLGTVDGRHALLDVHLRGLVEDEHVEYAHLQWEDLGDDLGG